MVPAVLLCGGMLAVGFGEAGADAKPADLAAYEAASKGLGRDADSHVRLALWCEAHGLKAERLKHLTLAVLSDPSHAAARGLLGLVSYSGRWKRPEDVADKVKADEAVAARLAEYNGRRARTADTADAQWALALWCEQNGLDAEALAHFTAVTRLDPSREAAWKRLGCKKVDGRWVTPAQLAAERDAAEAQKRGFRHWKPILTKWRSWLGDKDKDRAREAQEALAGLTDPLAVQALWSVFVAGGASHRELVVQVLGQIDSPEATRALAHLAVFDPAAEIRRRATETLKQRDPREYGGMLVALLRDPIEYEVRPVGGPGSPGALFVAGQRYNVQRLYAPPAMPGIAVTPSDQITYDVNGLPVIVRSRSSTRTESSTVSTLGRMSLDEFAHFNPTDPALSQAVADFRATESAQWTNFFQTHHHNAALMRSNPVAERRNLGVAINNDVHRTATTEQQTQIPVGQIMLEYQKAALSAQQQLAQDVAELDAYNAEVKRLNGRVSQVLKGASGSDRGESRASWRAWYVDQQGYAYHRPKEKPRPTVVENVPPAYTPQPEPPITTTSTRVVSTTELSVDPYSSMPSCFGAGTLVRTLEGSRAIESIQVGDRVLTQDVRTGGLGYHPVTVIHHNPPSPTYLVKVGGDTIVSSPFHRFWIAGRGWVMARELKAGDVLRLLEGPASIESVEAGPVQPVFNLDVAESHDFFAGAAAALVHDNTLPDTRLAPFDAIRELAARTTAD
jgi:hypothetical protein